MIYIVIDFSIVEMIVQWDVWLSMIHDWKKIKINLLYIRSQKYKIV